MSTGCGSAGRRQPTMRSPISFPIWAGYGARPTSSAFRSTSSNRFIRRLTLSRAPPDPNDRPYAGVLTLDASLIQDTDTTRSILGVQQGWSVPMRWGGQVQNGFHDIINVGQVRGWGYQIHDEPVIELLGQRIWRFPLGTIGGFETDVLPNVEAAVGNLRIYGLAGGVIRFGEGLDSDFGVARVRPGMTGSDAYTPTRDFAWNVFFGLDGQAVPHDLTIEGNSFRMSPSASRRLFVGEIEAGLSVDLYGYRLSYTHVLQTHESRNQRGGLHQFGSLALSARF